MPSVDLGDVERLLEQHYAGEAGPPIPLAAGMFSEAYAFSVTDQHYVLRLNAYDADFRKDALAFQDLAPLGVPVPEVLHIGPFDTERHFAITRRCTGEPLDQVDPPTARRLVPKLFSVADRIHAANVAAYDGWGLTDAHGQGQFSSWGEYLQSFYNQKFAFEWTDLCRDTFMETGVYQEFSEAMLELLPYCPQEKYLVHGDFGFDNVISDGETITGVLDWAESRLGDFLYDIANLAFWSAFIPYQTLWEDHAHAQGWEVPNLGERIRCYLLLHIGLGGLAIAALQDDEEEYVRVRERTRELASPEADF